MAKKKAKKKKNKVGKPRDFFLTQVQLKKLDRMAKDQCKHRTIAEALGVDRVNLVNNYLPRLHKKGAEGRVELRRNQTRMSKNQVAMAIFLGKQKGILDQSDKKELEHSGEISLKPPKIL